MFLKTPFETTPTLALFFQHPASNDSLAKKVASLSALELGKKDTISNN